MDPHSLLTRIKTIISQSCLQRSLSSKTSRKCPLCSQVVNLRWIKSRPESGRDLFMEIRIQPQISWLLQRPGEEQRWIKNQVNHIGDWEQQVSPYDVQSIPRGIALYKYSLKHFTWQHQWCLSAKSWPGRELHVSHTKHEPEEPPGGSYDGAW